MITRERALAASSPRAIALVCVLVPWAAAIAWNAWDRRADILGALLPPTQ